MLPPLPPSLDVAFEVDAFACTLRGHDSRVALSTLRWAAPVFLLGVIALVSTVGDLPLTVLAWAIMFLPALVLAAVVFFRLTMRVMLSAPSRTTVRCDHQGVAVTVVVNGVVRERAVHLHRELAGARVTADGLELLDGRGGLARLIPAENPVAELVWVAAMIDEACQRRQAFDQEARDPEQVALRRAATRLVGRGEPPKAR